MNQYTNILPAAIQPVYDSDGNMTYDGKWGYVWDAENRLVAALPVVTNQGSVRLRFAYDYMSRRVGKEVETWTGMEWSNVVTIAFTYDGWNMVRETRSDESKPNYYVWGLDLSGTPQGAGGVGGLLARVRQENIPHPLYYASDANGNITDVLNTNGTLAAHYEYDPFGNIVALSGDLAGINPFRFSSKYWDEEVGVYYYGYRFYSPEMARWINRDPIEERGGLNLYVLAQNTPANTIDPLGLLQDHVSYAVYLSGLGGGIDVDTDTQMKDCCSDDGKMVKNGDIKLELTVKGLRRAWAWYLRLYF
ncbi:MAG: RHS repeat-associated core domain-containing protein [Kiritimatiellae bacterium]|nr:RHS repeat-associated core domain-containing protein [Kiritimatiellia bacterium]